MTSATTLLFEVKNGARTVVRRKINVMASTAVSLQSARSGYRPKNCLEELSGHRRSSIRMCFFVLWCRTTCCRRLFIRAERRRSRTSRRRLWSTKNSWDE